MIDKERFPKELIALIEAGLEGRSDVISVPPPVFDAMKGELVDHDMQEKWLTNRFPILQEHLNPYGNMQGGIIAAAIDNTIGPLSLLVSPPNFTRHMNIKYSKVVASELGHIFVTATFIGQKKRQLFFEAVVKDSDGNRLSSAEATHWVIG